jgi:muramidase (phage lysozyme)
MSKAQGFALGGLAVAGLVFYGLSQASQTSTANGEIPMGADLSPSAGDTNLTDYTTVSGTGLPLDLSGVVMGDAQANLDAVQFMIRSCEHRFPQDVVQTENCYQIFYGGAMFTDLSDHPVNTGEMKGVPLPAAMCVAAGFADGVCVSTAAGAYQITRPTWNAIRQASSLGPYLADFSPASQDEACRRLIVQKGAMPAIAAGDFQTAIGLLAGTWASLPGSHAQQNPKDLAFALARINESLTQA